MHESEELQQIFLAMCRQEMPILFKTCFWTFQPKRQFSPVKHVPFITWPVQDGAIRLLVDKIRNGGDILIDKSREMGATWIILGTMFGEWLLVPDSTLMIISRKEEYVWKRGNPDTLYWKLDYLWKYLPLWLQPDIELSERHMENKDNGSVIDGESTNADVGAGGRRQAVMCDEFSRVKAADANTIQETLSDTTPCRIFNSTPTGRGHPFGQLRFSGRVDVYALPWWEHPNKIAGWYESPEINRIIIYDLEYYKNKYPGVFDSITAGEAFTYSEFEKQLLVTHPDLTDLKFIADGNDPANQDYFSPTGKRSPWYDFECSRRSPRDKATNIDMDYVGSGDVVFPPLLLNRMLETYGKPPEVCGEVVYDVSNNTVTGASFRQGYGRQRLKLWCELRGNRPDQTHNYVIGCDVSLGSGNSNSVASIYDCNTNRKIGRWACPNTTPTHFCEMVVALAQWVGGVSETLICWENNGPGAAFTRRIQELDYPSLYRLKDEKSRRSRFKDAWGWHSSTDAKLNLMMDYSFALSAAFRPEQEEDAFVNPDIESVREAEDYVFYENGSLGPGGLEGAVGGEKIGHGDMVIADALCIRAREQQPRARLAEVVGDNFNSLAVRRKIANQRQAEAMQNSRYLF